MSKIIYTGTSKHIFNNEGNLKLDNVDVESMNSSSLIKSSDRDSGIEIKNCIIDESVNTSVDNCDSVDIKGSLIYVYEPVDIDTVNNVSIKDTVLQVNPSCKYSLSNIENLCKIDSSDVYLLDMTLNVHVIGDNDLIGCEINDSYLKDVDISYKMFYDASICNDIVFGDDVTGNIWAYWYGEIGLFVGGYQSGNVINIIYISILSNTSSYGTMVQNRSHGGSLSDSIYGFIHGGLALGATVTESIERKLFSNNSTGTYYSDLTIKVYSVVGCSDGNIGISCGGRINVSTYIDNINRINLKIPSNAIEYGNISSDRGDIGSISNRTYAFLAGGYDVNYGMDDGIRRRLFSSTADSSFFSNLSSERFGFASCANDTKGIWVGGSTATNDINTIEYFIFNIQADVSDFGDLIYSRRFLNSCYNEVRGVFGNGLASGITMEYITIDIESSGSIFGDITVGGSKGYGFGFSGN